MRKEKKKYSEEEKLRLLREYHESGVSKSRFVKDHGICNITLLTSWLRRYESEEKSVPLQPELSEEEIMANRSKEDYRKEIDAQKKRIKELEKALEFSRMETKVRDMMIDKAEEYFDIQIRKKVWGRVATELVSKDKYSVSLACRLFGHCRQAFYQSRADIEKESEHERQIVKSVKDIREEDPGIGAYKLWLMITDMYGRAYVMGRDRFYVVLRRHGLMLPPPKPRHTTNSNHRYHKWKNLVQGFIPMAANQLWVADITYIWTAEGVCYLYLVTDAYSHKIVGWVLADTLKASASIEALQQAIGQAVAMAGCDLLKGLIHHSDRGVQYCCDAYVATLRQYGISISMTEDYKPTDNAIAERANGIIKDECVYRQHQFNSISHAREVVGRFIDFYNNRRPHMSIGYKIPSVVHMEQGEQQRMWKNKIYRKIDTENGKNVVPLQSQTKSPGESVCQQP